MWNVLGQEKGSVVVKLRDRHHFASLEVHKRIILKWILKE
jgi:hypothetical protein